MPRNPLDLKKLQVKTVICKFFINKMIMYLNKGINNNLDKMKS